jgi:tRNA pseudouridine38-40 synthase
MPRYFIQLSYNGTKYCGWQTQPNGITVQQLLDEKLALLLKQKTVTVGAGRTDTGVHATEMFAHFDTDKVIDNLPKTANALNRMLPFDIAVQNIVLMHDGAHARFDAIERTYHYFIHHTKNPFLQDSSAFLSTTLNINAMNQAAQLLLQTIDFTSFSKLHTDVKTNDCNVTKAMWTQENNQLKFTITANRFLRNMVRAIVGTLVDVGKGKLSLQQFEHIILSKNRALASESAPAKGLYLVQIKYPLGYFKN